jgi:hypothetical protein
MSQCLVPIFTPLPNRENRTPAHILDHSLGQETPSSSGEIIMSCSRKYRAEFDKSIAIDKRDFAAIEFLLRKGRRQLELYSAPGIKDIR